ncbi:MAG: 50S ribosomal protein L3 [Parcubacteria group bacterium GW2011_GWE2_38_18]|nr:MAG: 50S ribosomal protein L3 [Parcubacteria group bacterium GW2011_GWE2_38_18]
MNPRDSASQKIDYKQIMKFILGKKIEMTQVWKNELIVPVTKVKVEPGVIVQLKTAARDGYTSAVVGFGTRREKNINKPQLGQMKDLGKFRFLKEFRYKHKEDSAEFEKLNRGDKIDLNTFEVGDMVNVQGTSKGKGFQGGVKRHGFHGQDKTHGNKDQLRMPGSVGAGEPQHVFKGTRMAGHMGNKTATVTNLKIVEVNPEEQTISILGGIPGARNSVVYIIGRGELKVSKQEVKEEVKSEKAEEVKVEVVSEKVEEVKSEVVSEKAEVKTEEPKAEDTSTSSAQDVKVEAPIVEEPKVEEAKTPEPKVEDTSTSSAQDAKAEEPKVEEVKAEVKKEEPKEEKFEDTYIDKFNKLSKEEKDKFSSAEMTEAISALEEKYKLDLVPLVTMIVVKEIAIEDLTNCS